MGSSRGLLGRPGRNPDSHFRDARRHISLRSLHSPQNSHHGWVQAHGEVAPGTVFRGGQKLPQRWPRFPAWSATRSARHAHPIQSNFSRKCFATPRTSRNRHPCTSEPDIRGSGTRRYAKQIVCPQSPARFGAHDNRCKRFRTRKCRGRSLFSVARSSSRSCSTYATSHSRLVRSSRKESYAIQKALSQVLAQPAERRRRARPRCTNGGSHEQLAPASGRRRYRPAN